MKLRAWLERGAILVAALATIATSRKGWVVDAKLPPDDPSVARIVVVEASYEPHLWVEDGNATLISPGRYLLRSGQVLRQVMVSEKCSGSMCKKCEAPSDAKVRVVSITPVKTWKREVTQSPDQQPTVLEPKKWTTYNVHLDSLHAARLTVKTSGPKAYVSGANQDFRIDFDEPTVRTEVTWSVTATIEEPCPDPTTPCEPSADDTLRIAYIQRQVQNAP